jgi:Leu/Phe-tRNA-protein transferase
MSMDIYTATGLAEGWIEADDQEQVVEAWQTLHDTGAAYTLQGWFGRTAQDLIAQGVISA